MGRINDTLLNISLCKDKVVVGESFICDKQFEVDFVRRAMKKDILPMFDKLLESDYESLIIIVKKEKKGYYDKIPVRMIRKEN